MTEDAAPGRARTPWEDVVRGYERRVRLVDPDDYPDHAPPLVRRSFVQTVVVEALSAAADADGVLPDLEEHVFFAAHMAAAIQAHDEPDAPVLVYDRFAAYALIDAMNRLEDAGLLVHRGNGDTVDYRLALPVDTDD